MRRTEPVEVLFAGRIETTGFQEMFCFKVPSGLDCLRLDQQISLNKE
jgi:hypothetical protein